MNACPTCRGTLLRAAEESPAALVLAGGYLSGLDGTGCVAENAPRESSAASIRIYLRPGWHREPSGAQRKRRIRRRYAPMAPSEGVLALRPRHIKPDGRGFQRSADWESNRVEPDELTQERVARNDARFRDANEGIEASAESHGLTDMRIPFICECADTGCATIIRLSVSEYEEIRADPRTFLNAPGHVVAALGTAEVVTKRESYEIVRKTGHAGDVAERLDQRTATEAEEAAS